MSIDLNTVSVNELCACIKIHAAAQQWDEAMRLYEHIVCARLGELSEAEREKLRQLIQPALTAPPPEAILTKTVNRVSHPAVTPPKPTPPPASQKKVNVTSQKFPASLWEEVLRVMVSERRALPQNMWLQHQLRILQDMSMQKRTEGVILFLEACYKARDKKNISRELLSAVLTVFCIYNLISSQEYEDWLARLDM